MAEGTARQTADGRPCEFVSACISARGGEGVKVNPIQAINVCQTCSHVPLGGDFLHITSSCNFNLCPSNTLILLSPIRFATFSDPEIDTFLDISKII